MSELQFPKNPVVGQEYDFPPYKYYWDGVKWKTKGIGYNPVNDLRDELEPRIETSEKNIEDLEERLLDIGAKIYRGSNEQYVQNGDTIPAGTTHLTVLINGKPKDVVMTPQTSGLVSNLLEYSATIGGREVAFKSNRSSVIVDDFGIKPDGVDYTVRMQTLIDLFIRVGVDVDFVFLQSEQPYILRTLYIREYSCNISFIGLGGKVKLKRPDNYDKTNFSNNRFFTVANSTTLEDSHDIQPCVKFKNLILDGNRSGQDSWDVSFGMQHHHLINVSGPDSRLYKHSRVICEDVDFRNSGGEGISLFKHADVSVYRPTFHNCFRGGITIVGSDNILKVRDAVSDDDLETNINGNIQGYNSGYYEEVEDTDNLTPGTPYYGRNNINKVDIDGWTLKQGWFKVDPHPRDNYPTDISRLKNRTYRNIVIEKGNITPKVDMYGPAVYENCEIHSSVANFSATNCVYHGCKFIVSYSAKKFPDGSPVGEAIPFIVKPETINWNHGHIYNRSALFSSFTGCLFSFDETVDISVTNKLHLLRIENRAALVENILSYKNNPYVTIDMCTFAPYSEDWKDESQIGSGVFERAYVSVSNLGAGLRVVNSNLCSEIGVIQYDSSNNSSSYTVMKGNQYNCTEANFSCDSGAFSYEENDVWGEFKFGVPNVSYADLDQLGNNEIFVFADPTDRTQKTLINFAVMKVGSPRYLSFTKHIQLPVKHVVPGTLVLLVKDYTERMVITDDGLGNLTANNSDMTATINYNTGLITITGVDTTYSGSGTGNVYLSCDYINNVVACQGTIAKLISDKSRRWIQTTPTAQGLFNNSASWKSLS